jgi:sialic acid synthase SpsE
MGARIIEKHFTIDKNLPGPDHQASANSDEFKSLVNAVRRAENMLGSSKKSIQVEERQMYNVSRKSIVLKYDMNMGDIIKLSDLELKRPGTGLMSKDIKFLIGKKLKKDLKKNHLISYEDLDE